MKVQKFLLLTSYNCRFNNISRYLNLSARIFKKKEDKTKELAKCMPLSEGTCIPDPDALDSNFCQPTVVIVGAGMAGISAARRLSQCGIQQITILEALNRPGGRIHSCYMAGKPAELGAQWIEGCCYGNPIFNLANQEGLLPSPVERVNPNRGIFYTSSGYTIEEKILKPARNIFHDIKRQAECLFTSSWKAHGSLFDFMKKKILEASEKFPDYYKTDAQSVMYSLMNDIRCRWGEDLSNMASEQFGNFRSIPCGDSYLPLGFNGVLAPLMRGLPEKCIKYNKEVGLIKWGPTGNVSPRAVVKCIDGECFPADYVIVTMSLGVLKAQAESIFVPQLPEEKLCAIENLGYGNTNKIFMQYEKPFWVCKEGFLKPTWTLKELSDRSQWVKAINLVEEVPGCPAVLMCSVGGIEALCVERLSESAIAQEMTKFLRKILKDPTVPFPKMVLKSEWVSNKYFCGSACYMGMKSLEGQQITLASPLPGKCHPVAPILFFAGEATVPRHYSTVQGARLSGLREADRILELTRSFGGPPKCEEFVSTFCP